MTNQEFLVLSAEVERLQALHEASLTDRAMGIEEKRAISDEYTRKYRELNDYGLSCVAAYKNEY
jgi:hypothetical protein